MFVTHFPIVCTFRTRPDKSLAQLWSLDWWVKRKSRRGKDWKVFLFFISMVNFILLQDWRDLRLRWNPENFSNIDNIIVPESLLWTPDFVFYDQASEFSYHIIPSSNLRLSQFWPNVNIKIPFSSETTNLIPSAIRSARVRDLCFSWKSGHLP